jgi:HD-like signal output (HDOD) protein
MKLDQFFSQATSLPTVPKIVQELIQSFQNDDVDIDSIISKLTKDQALTAKVLRLANSVRYGGNRKVGSAHDAVVMLGMDALRTLVLASGITGAFKYPATFDRKQFWRQSFAVAEISKWLAPFAKLDRETAFTCGMLHNIGTILVVITAPQAAEKFLTETGAIREKCEIDAMGFSTSDVSSELANRWQFPTSIVNALRYQNHPLLPQKTEPLANLLYIARYLAQGLDSQVDNVELARHFPNDVAKPAGIDPSALLTRIDELREVESDFAELVAA